MKIKFEEMRSPEVGELVKKDGMAIIPMLQRNLEKESTRKQLAGFVKSLKNFIISR